MGAPPTCCAAAPPASCREGADFFGGGGESLRDVQVSEVHVQGDGPRGCGARVFQSGHVRGRRCHVRSPTTELRRTGGRETTASLVFESKRCVRRHDDCYW